MKKLTKTEEQEYSNKYGITISNCKIQDKKIFESHIDVLNEIEEKTGYKLALDGVVMALGGNILLIRGKKWYEKL